MDTTMTAPESSGSDRPGGATGPVEADSSEQPVTRLRGNTVEVNLQHTARVAVGVGLVALIVLAVVLLVAGIHTNNQINRLRHDGVPVSVRVTSCSGLIGGSGSQVAGYSCTGTYVVDGTRYVQTIPGTAVFYAVGSKFQGVVVPSDPKLLSTPAQVAAQHASNRVFLLPAVLILVAMVWAAALVVRRKRRAAGDAGLPTRGAR